jgi:hypothetical protein
MSHIVSIMMFCISWLQYSKESVHGSFCESFLLYCNWMFCVHCLSYVSMCSSSVMPLLECQCGLRSINTAFFKVGNSLWMIRDACLTSSWHANLSLQHINYPTCMDYVPAVVTQFLLRCQSYFVVTSAKEITQYWCLFLSARIICVMCCVMFIQS